MKQYKLISYFGGIYYFLKAVLKLIPAIFKGKAKYTLTFEKENETWYIKFPHWPFEKKNLEMISGAAKLCEAYANGKNEVSIKVITSNTTLFLGFIHTTLVKQESALTYGADYSVYPATNKNLYDVDTEKLEAIHDAWICPVTLFVLGRYPKYIYIEKNNEP